MCSQGEVYADESHPSHIRIPHTYDEAINDSVYGEKWRAACLDDFTGKYTNLGSWELVKDLPPGRKAIKGKWVFSVKLKPDKSIKKFKARYVDCSYSQIAGIYYEETFCSTLCQESLRVLCAATCAADDEMLEMDIVKAFPSGE